MSNTITAYFKGRTGVAEAVYQNDYGIVIEFDGIYLPANFDCYFSVPGSDTATAAVGADNRVAIPNSVLGNSGNMSVHIPLHTGANDSEVEYVAYFKVIGRARPEDDGTPAQMTAIEKALALLSQPITNIEEIVNEALSFTGDTFAEMKAELQADFNNFKSDVNGDIADVEADFSVLQGQFDTAVAAVTTDTEVTDIRVGADGITDTTAGASVRRQFTDVKSACGNTSIALSEGYITCNVDVGDTVSLTPTVSNTYYYAIVDCSPYDEFTIQGHGGNAPRLYAFVDENSKLITEAPANQDAYMMAVKAPANASKLILNLSRSSVILPYAAKGSPVKAKFERLDNALLLDRLKAHRLNHADINDPYSDITDLNDLTTEGNYYLGSTPEAQGMSNMPIKAPGRLTVMSLLNDVYMQIYDANISGDCRRFYRNRDGGGTWFEWKEIVDVKLLDNTFLLNRNMAYRLNHAGETHPYKDITDLNDLTTEGNYYLGSTPEAQGMSNIPVASPGQLTVMSLLYDVYMQTYDANISGDCRRFYRNRDGGGTWFEWKEIAYINRHTKLKEFTPDVSTPYTQSCCVTDKYIYIANIIDDNTKETVYKFDKFSLASKGSTDFNGLIKHANDFTWNPDDKKIYCACGGGTQKVIVFDEELTQLDTITFSITGMVSLSCIAYDPISKLWAISGSYGEGNQRYINIYESLTDASPMEVFECDYEFQGISFLNYCVFGIVSSGTITIYNLDGDEVSQASIGNPVDLVNNTLEFESVQIVNNNAICSIHDHTASKSLLYSTPLKALFNVPTLI